MDERGSITLVGLWTTATAAAIALSVLSIARSRGEEANRALAEAHARFAAVDAALLAHSGRFDRDRIETTIDGCRLVEVRSFADEGKRAVLDCDVQTGALHHHCRSEWIHAGVVWTPVSWSER